MPSSPFLRTITAEVLAFLLASSCAGCDEPGTLLCGGCRAALSAAPVSVRTPDGVEVAAALEFDGVAARCIRRLKGEGETLLAHPLGAALASVADPDGLFVPVPTTRTAYRRRGYRVPELLLRRAGLDVRRLLMPAGSHADQRGLGIAERAANVRGSMRARASLGGGRVVVFDDVITTGATIDEASRALRAAGFEVAGALALAATPRHS